MPRKVNTGTYFEGGAAALKASDIPKGGQLATIQEFDEAKTRLGLRPLLRIKGFDGALFLNKTKLNFLIDKFGDDADAWAGKKVRLVRVRVNNPTTGKMQDGIGLE